MLSTKSITMALSFSLIAVMAHAQDRFQERYQDRTQVDYPPKFGQRDEYFFIQDKINKAYNNINVYGQPILESLGHSDFYINRINYVEIFPHPYLKIIKVVGEIQFRKEPLPSQNFAIYFTYNDRDGSHTWSSSVPAR